MINKFINDIGIDKLSNYLVEIVDCYFKPLKFFNNFSTKTLNEKIIQTIFYSILLIGIGYVLISDITVRYLSKAILYEIGTLFPVIITLVLSEIFIAKVKNEKPKYEDVIFFPIILKILIAPLQLIFFGIFISTENYNYFFLSNLVIFGLTFYIFILSPFIFNNKKKFVALNIFSNLIVISIITYIASIVSLDDYRNYEYPYVDRILLERFDKGEQFEDFFTIPEYKVLQLYGNERGRVFYLLANPFDSTSSGSIERTIDYQKTIKRNIMILDTLELKFKRNKEFFNKSKTLFVKIDSLTKNNGIIDLFKIKGEDIIRASKIIDNDSLVMYKEYIIELPLTIADLNNELIREQMEIENRSLNSIKPLKLLKYFRPLSLLEKSNRNSL